MVSNNTELAGAKEWAPSAPPTSVSSAQFNDLLAISNTFSLKPSVSTMRCSCAFISACLLASYRFQVVKAPTMREATCAAAPHDRTG